jgi:hypothetical protein
MVASPWNHPNFVHDVTYRTTIRFKDDSIHLPVWRCNAGNLVARCATRH